MGLRLGALDLTSRIVQSPLAACSDLPFRLVARRRGLGYCFLEMVSAQALVRENAKTLKMLQTTPEDRPLGAQLLGRDPEIMARAAEMLEAHGFDAIDLNLGCPVRKVVDNGEGSALLGEPDHAERVFAAVRRAVKRAPVTVKMRKGLKDPSGDQAVELAKRAQEQGIDAVTVHGRTQAQLYTGLADWSAIGRVKAAVKIPVIGNGDVITSEDARKRHAETHCDGIMIGRAGLGNPWVYKNLDGAFTQEDAAPTPTVAERKAALLEHFELERRYQGERQCALNMRRIVVWYTQGLPGNKTLRVAVCQTLDNDAIGRMIADYFDALPLNVPPPMTPVLLAE